MRVEFLPSIDFNQMLVYSTFAHLLFLTWAMFLPDPKTHEQIVVPTFRLDLIELTAKAKPISSPKKKVILKKKPVIKKPIRSKLKPKAKQLPLPKTIVKESKARKKILEDLKSIESDLPKQSALKQLDLLARLVPKAQDKAVLPKELPEAFRELEREKATELPMKLEPKAQVPVEPKPEKSLPPVDDVEITAKENELIELSEQLVKLDLKKEAQSTSALMRELEAIQKKEVNSIDIASQGEQLEDLKNPSVFENIKGESLTSVAEKFQKLEDSSEEIKIDVSQERVVSKEFKTSIQRGVVPVPETEAEVSSVLSLYVGQIYKRVYSNWKTPLGQKFKDAMVSFVIFSKGNIDNPIVRESTGDKNLDSIAVRAILDSVPFPALPKELNRSNLKVNIIFKYVPEKE